MADPIITKIGDVSAYLDAVAHGFEGTRAEFGELLANSANYAQSAESAASAAVASAATATTKAGEATTAATAAQTAKTQTEAAASQALTDIGTAESGAISAIQTEGATQTANATAQAQAAATSATTASTKASEASASATTATTKATEAAASATSAANAASVAQGVLESIPEDYSDLSEDVDQLKADLVAVKTGYVKLESGTYADSDGMQKSTNSTRIRNTSPLAINGLSSITIPDGYQAWFFRLDINYTLISAYGSWLDGKIDMTKIATSETKFLTFAIKNASTPTSDISDQIDIVQDGIKYASTADDIYDLNQRTEELLEYGKCDYTNYVNGTYLSRGVLQYTANRVRLNDFLSVKVGDVIAIKNGSYQHSVGIWIGTPSASTIVRSDSAWVTKDEEITITVNGYFMVAFSDPENMDSPISLADFDATVSIANTLAYKNKMALGDYEIPSYYMANDYLGNKVERINQLAEQGDDVFFFITDVHWERNAKHSPALIHYIAQKCHVPRLFDGGDLADGVKQDAIDAYETAFGGKIYRLTGNHDWFPPQNGKSLYYWLNSKNYDQIGAAYKHYWYVDNMQAKIRYITLNSFTHTGSALDSGWSYGFDSEQIMWFVNTALDVPEGYDVIVFTHYFRDSSGGSTGYDSIESAIATFNNDTASHGKVLCVFEGHRHWDSVFHTSSGVPVILTTCDKYDISNEPTITEEVRTLGTINEQAFEVCIVNREAKTITCVRIGALAQDNEDVSIGGEGFTLAQTLEERVISYE